MLFTLIRRIFKKSEHYIKHRISGNISIDIYIFKKIFKRIKLITESIDTFIFDFLQIIRICLMSFRISSQNKSIYKHSRHVSYFSICTSIYRSTDKDIILICKLADCHKKCTEHYHIFGCAICCTDSVNLLSYIITDLSGNDTSLKALLLWTRIIKRKFKNRQFTLILLGPVLLFFKKFLTTVYSEPFTIILIMKFNFRKLFSVADLLNLIHDDLC